MLDQFKEIKICTAYKRASERTNVVPLQSNELIECLPVYEKMAGWASPTAGARKWGDLPAGAIRYLERLSDLIEVPVDIISTGADRNDTVVVHHPFD